MLNNHLMTLARMVLPISLIPAWLVAWGLRFFLPWLWAKHEAIRTAAALGIGIAMAGAGVVPTLLYQQISGRHPLSRDYYFLFTFCTGMAVAIWIVFDSNKTAKARQHGNGTETLPQRDP